MIFSLLTVWWQHCAVLLPLFRDLLLLWPSRSIPANMMRSIFWTVPSNITMCCCLTSCICCHSGLPCRCSSDSRCMKWGNSTLWCFDGTVQNPADMIYFALCCRLPVWIYCLIWLHNTIICLQNWYTSCISHYCMFSMLPALQTGLWLLWPQSNLIADMTKQSVWHLQL